MNHLQAANTANTLPRPGRRPNRRTGYYFGTALALACAAPAWALDGRQIMEKNDALPEGKTMQGSSILIIQKGGSEERKEFSTRSKKFGAATRARITFTKPTQIEFLTWSEPGADSQQWIKLSGGAVRKIASSDKGSSFVNSHFYYEDIGDRSLNDYSYQLIGEEAVGGDECYKVKSVKIKGTKVYDQAVGYVRKKDFVIVRVDFYEGGALSKILRSEKIEWIQGIPTPRKLVMEQYKGGKLVGKSLMYVTAVQYNGAVSDNILTREAL